MPWSVAAQATLHCLTGCAIGEVLGMVIGTADLHNATTVALSIVLAFAFGSGLTMRGLLRAGVEDAGLTSGLFWASLAFSLLVAFLLTTPVNRWMISRGRRHAVVHGYHH